MLALDLRDAATDNRKTDFAPRIGNAGFTSAGVIDNEFTLQLQDDGTAVMSDTSIGSKVAIRMRCWICSLRGGRN